MCLKIASALLPTSGGAVIPTLSEMPRVRKATLAPAVAFTKATCATNYGTESNTQSNTQSNDPTPDPARDPTLDPTYDLTPDLDVFDTPVVPEKGKKVSLLWTNIMEETLFNSLLEQDHISKCADIGYKANA